MINSVPTIGGPFELTEEEIEKVAGGFLLGGLDISKIYNDVIDILLKYFPPAAPPAPPPDFFPGRVGGPFPLPPALGRL